MGSEFTDIYSLVNDGYWLMIDNWYAKNWRERKCKPFNFIKESENTSSHQSNWTVQDSSQKFLNDI